MNVERARFDKLISSQEIATLITALGTGIGKDEYAPEKLRYHRIIVMTDADVDGSHIRTLLLTFFYRQMPELVERGHIYIAQPPLYKVKLGRDERYLKDDQEFKQFLLKQALRDAELVAGEGEAPLARETFENIAQDYFLAEAVIDRLSRVIEPAVLHATLSVPSLDLSSAAAASASCNALQAAVDAAVISIRPERDERRESYRLAIVKNIHGNTYSTYLDQDFVDSGDYAQIKKTAHVLQGLIRPGARVKRGDNVTPVESFKQAVHWLLEEVKGGLAVQRYKGLGEMNPEQLWETTMDPTTRRLLRVQIEDAIGADEIFTTLMGEEVEARRLFIESNALGVRNLDV